MEKYTECPLSFSNSFMCSLLFEMPAGGHAVIIQASQVRFYSLNRGTVDAVAPGTYSALCDALKLAMHEWVHVILDVNAVPVSISGSFHTRDAAIAAALANGYALVTSESKMVAYYRKVSALKSKIGSAALIKHRYKNKKPLADYGTDMLVLPVHVKYDINTPIDTGLLNPKHYAQYAVPSIIALAPAQVAWFNQFQYSVKQGLTLIDGSVSWWIINEPMDRFTIGVLIKDSVNQEIGSLRIRPMLTYREFCLQIQTISTKPGQEAVLTRFLAKLDESMSLIF